MLRRVLYASVMFLCMGAFVFADQLVLTDGSVLKGTVKQILGNKVQFDTAFAGELTIPQSLVKEISTDKPMSIKTADGTKDGRLVVENGEVKLAGLALLPATIQAAWVVGAVDPTLPKGRVWKYEANAEITGKTGNTEKTTLGGGLKATLEGPEDKLLLFARGRYAKENGVENEQEINLGADFERQINKTNNSWYARGEFEHDKPNNYERYYTAAGGYGYYFIRTDDLKVRVRVGLSYMKKEYVNDQSSDSGVGLDSNYHHEIRVHDLWGFRDPFKLVTDVSYTPAFDNWCDDYRVYHESAVDIPLGGSKVWSLRLGVSNDYKNRVSGDTKRLDTAYFARLVLNWE